jgi:F0F1-type ATP synthase assembly protein I
MTKDAPSQLWTRYALVGTEFAAAVAIMVIIGLLVDRWAGTRVVFTLIGAAVGFVAATWRLVQAARNIRGGKGKP